MSGKTFTRPTRLAEIKRIGPQRAVITHISHDIDYYRDSHLLPEGVEFAYDGLVMEIP